MTVFATWLFLGLVVPQLGVAKQELISARYLRMDQNAGQDWYVQFLKSGSGGLAPASVFVNSGRVTAVILKLDQLSQQLDQRIEKDERCKRVGEARFSCSLAGPYGDVDVAACDGVVVVHSARFPQAQARVLELCDPRKASAEGTIAEPARPTRRWFTSERIWPLVVATVAIAAALGFAFRHRSRRGRKIR